MFSKILILVLLGTTLVLANPSSEKNDIIISDFLEVLSILKLYEQWYETKAKKDESEWKRFKMDLDNLIVSEKANIKQMNDAMKRILPGLQALFEKHLKINKDHQEQRNQAKEAENTKKN